MNLIEQLGGYEKSKRELKLKEEGSMFQCCMSISAEMIRDALLQHRREKNIFEVGDLVVFVSEKMDFLDDDKVHEISVITENNLLKVCGLYVGFDAVKHATDKEIAQGYRDE